MEGYVVKKAQIDRKKRYCQFLVSFSLAVFIVFLLISPVAGSPSGGSSGSSSSGGTSYGTSMGMSFLDLKPPAPKPPLPAGQFAQTYPIGFYGLNFNVNNQKTLEIDLGAARAAKAEVTPYPDRIEVYQHSSPAVLITFWGEGWEFRNGKVSGSVTRADFVTTPLIGNISEGDVSGSVRVDLYTLIGPSELTKTIDANVTADIERIFQNATYLQNLGYENAAFTMNVTKVLLEQTGAANLTFTVPPAWVSSHGGVDSVRIARISEKDHITQILDTRYLGEDANGAMKFTAYSPDGTSVFGMITTKAVMEKGGKPSEGQIMTDVGMLVWVSQLAFNNIYLVAIGAVIVVVVLYIGWMGWKSKRKGEL